MTYAYKNKVQFYYFYIRYLYMNNTYLGGGRMVFVKFRSSGGCHHTDCLWDSSCQCKGGGFWWNFLVPRGGGGKGNTGGGGTLVCHSGGGLGRVATTVGGGVGVLNVTCNMQKR